MNQTAKYYKEEAPLLTTHAAFYTDPSSRLPASGDVERPGQAFWTARLHAFGRHQTLARNGSSKPPPVIPNIYESEVQANFKDFSGYSKPHLRCGKTSTFRTPF